VVQQRTLVRGQEYWVGVYADDLRQAFQLGAGGNGNGALAVYLDLLYNDRYVQAVRVPVSSDSPLGLEVLYGTRYAGGNSQASGKFQQGGGIIDELGITSDGSVGSAANLPVLYVKFRASALTPNNSFVQMWKSDPADGKANEPGFDPSVIVNDEDPPNSIRNVDPENIAYLGSQGFRVVSAAAASSALMSAATTTTSSSSLSLAAAPTRSTTTSPSGPSQQELLAYFANIGSGNTGSQISSTAKSSSSPKTTDDAILSLLDELLASKKSR
jgi:hypothetical protein